MQSTHYLDVCLFTIALVTSAQGGVIYESATLGPLTGSGTTLYGDQYLGARFSLAEPIQVQAVGGHMYGIDGGSLFGAIVSLSSPSALPSGNPFDMTTIATVTFTLPVYQDADVAIPLEVELQPGNYALIFGSGQFGSHGVGGMPTDNTDIPGQASYFGWYNNRWNDDGFSRTRFVVYGELVPEPSAVTLFGMLWGGSFVLKWRCRKKIIHQGLRKKRE